LLILRLLSGLCTRSHRIFYSPAIESREISYDLSADIDEKLNHAPVSLTRLAPKPTDASGSSNHRTPPHPHTHKPKSPVKADQAQRNHSPAAKDYYSSPNRPNSNPSTPTKTPGSKQNRGSPNKSPYITPTRSPKPGNPKSPGSPFSPNRFYSTEPVRIGVKVAAEPTSTSHEGSASEIRWEIGDVYRAAGVFAYSRKPPAGPESEEQLVGLVLCEFRENKQRLTFPGGKIDAKDGNDPFKTALREFHEETRGVFELLEADVTAQFVERFPSNCFYAAYGKYFITALEVPYKADVFEAFRSRPSIEDKTDKLFWLELPSFNTRRPTISIEGEEYEWHRFTMSLLKDDRLQQLLATISGKASPARSASPSKTEKEVDAIVDSIATLKV
jgi:8-oxo-dGTP pyrophosphatase MutT (NUDIX family)